MNNFTLYPHNQAAYDAVIKHYMNGHRKAAVIQATGTGKSFVGGAVARHFDKVLIVAPNDYVLNQAKSTTPHADTVTYAYLALHDDMPTDYNLIWIDEFHHIGAPTWQIGVDNLIKANPNAKILGTTATPDRSLEQRNMADEFFDGDVVSNMTLTDAWVNNILRVPKYVIGVVSMGSTEADYSTRINSSKRINEAQKKEANALLDNIVRDWSYSYGVPQILSKYITSDVERMIVFAQTINKLDEVVSSIRPWFNEAGIKLANVYAVHSQMGNEAKKQMEAFENDTTEGIKVLVSVDMLNEGIHVRRVDAVMLLRSTISKNLYMQQIGRCFTIGQEHQPIILDLADNLTSACGYDGIYQAQFQYAANAASRSDSEHTPDEFMIIDTLKETRELISQIDRNFRNRPAGYWDVKEHCQEEALKYSTRYEFAKANHLAYISSIRNGWLDEVCSHMAIIRQKITFDRCLEAAKQCSSGGDFRNRFKCLHEESCKRGWREQIYDICGFYRPYTREECLEFAKQYNTPTEFLRGNKRAYGRASHQGWLDDCCAHMTYINKKNGYWTKEHIQAEALKYTNLTDFTKNSGGAVGAARKLGILHEVCSHMDIQTTESITKERCIEAASKCKTRNEFHDIFPHLHYYASKKGFIEEICAHMPHQKLTKEECHKEALKYQSRVEFCKNSSKHYHKAAREKWIDDICSHMVRKCKPNGYWTKERCAEAALECHTRSEFYDNHHTAATTAAKNGWMDDICSHMTKPATPYKYWTKERVLEEFKKSRKMTDVKYRHPSAYRAAQRDNYLDECRAVLSKSL